MVKKKISELKITLIGGGGFIGHNLALHLNGMGVKVDIIDSLQVNNLYAFGIEHGALRQTPVSELHR